MMKARLSSISFGDNLFTTIWTISIENGSISDYSSSQKIANRTSLRHARNAIFKKTLKMPYGTYYSANNKNNHHENSNYGSLPMSQTPIAELDSAVSTLAYGESELDVINRSLVLTTNVSANTTFPSNIINPPSTVFMANTTKNVTTAINADEEWARFYDLMLSWQGICLIAVFSTFIVVTIIGNTLVILAVITTRRLKTVTNCFVMSLAVADLLVGIFVMPPAVAVHLIGSWRLGWVLCDIWISLDVLLCTASILSLCAISVDRYLAVTQPLTYSRKRRSKRLAFCMILIVWVLALAITCPPMLGWYEPGRRDLNECRYNQNEGYVIFSAMGSFFIPMAVMIYVYARISCVVASRHDHMTDISVHNKKFKRYTAADVDNDMDHDFSEQELSSGQRKQAAARTFSNQTLAKELHDIMLCEGETGESNTTAVVIGGGNGNGGDSSSHRHSLLTLATANTKNSCYELTRPSSLKRTPTSSSTMTVMTSGCGGASGTSGTSGALNVAAVGSTSASDQHWPSRTLSVRHHHNFGTSDSSTGISGNISAGNVTTSPNQQPEAAAFTRHTRIQQQHHHHHTKSFSNRVTSLRKENKTTQTLSIVVGGFIACWLPFFIYYLITPFLEEHQVSRTLAKGLTWLGWFNSAINPFIYAFYSVDFRAAFWRLTCKRFFSGHMKAQFPTNTMSIRR